MWVLHISPNVCWSWACLPLVPSPFWDLASALPWHLCSVDALLVGAATTSYAVGLSINLPFPLKASSPWVVLGGERRWSPDVRPRVTTSFKGDRRVRWSFDLRSFLPSLFVERPSDGGYHQVGATTRGGAGCNTIVLPTSMLFDGVTSWRSGVVFHLVS
jgi:hypothetical protein